MSVHSSLQNCYAASRSISLSFVIAPSSALITGSLTPSVIGERPSPPIYRHLIPDILDKYGVIHIPSWLTMGSIDDARAILSAMMGAVATVLALIFSVALLVLSLVSTLLAPRLLYRFLQDWCTQVTIGMFMG